MSETGDQLRALVAEVAAAYFSNSPVSPSDIPNVISQISSSLAAVGQSSPAPEPEPAPTEEAPSTVGRPTPAQIRKSITPDALISFEDGRRYKTLKRHLSTRGLSIEDYKAKWGLPADYPSVSPNYSAARSQMAKNLGLGSKGGRRKSVQAQ